MKIRILPTHANLSLSFPDTNRYISGGTSLSVQDSFGTYTFGTFFRTASFGTLNVNIGTVTFGTYKTYGQLRYINVNFSTSVFCTKVLTNRSQPVHCDF